MREGEYPKRELAAYCAAALLMPYDRFARAVEAASIAVFVAPAAAVLLLSLLPTPLFTRKIPSPPLP